MHALSSWISRPRSGIRADASFSEKHLLMLLFLIFPSVRDIWKEQHGSFDRRALICWNPVPFLTQASHKSAQVGEPGMDRGCNMPVSYKGGEVVGGLVKGRRRSPAENVLYLFQQVQTCQTCCVRVTCTHIKKTKEIIFISYF